MKALTAVVPANKIGATQKELWGRSFSECFAAGRILKGSSFSECIVMSIQAIFVDPDNPDAPRLEKEIEVDQLQQR